MKTWATAAIGIFFCLGVAAGCGDDEMPTDLGVKDFTVGPDYASSPFAGVACGDMSCPGGTVCCVRPSGPYFVESCDTTTACMMGGAAAVCDGPEDCPGGGDCCAHVSFMRTGPDTAVPSSGKSECVTGCMASVAADQTTITFNSKLCHVTGDCAGYMGDLYGTQIPFDGCCYRPEIDLRFCAPSDPSYSSLGGYYCLK